MQNSAQFSDNSKVWIYQSSRPFSDNEIATLNTKLASFAVQWVAHNKQLMAQGKVIADRFIMLMVDETHTGASGCSIDTSMRFLKELEAAFNISLLDRTLVNYESTSGIQTIALSELQDKFKSGIVTRETIVYDPLVNTKIALDTSFKTPLVNTWMNNFI